MKQVYKILLLSFVASFLFYGCISFGVRGTGKISSITKDLSSYKNIELEGEGTVEIVNNQIESIRIETDDNLLQYIKTDINNETLRLYPSRPINPTKLKYYISKKYLESVAINGSGDINIKNMFEAKDFAATINGSGNININSLKVSNFIAVIEGSGKISASGESQMNSSKIHGSGNIDLSDFKLRSSDVIINGSGDCRVSPVDKLSAQINGSGNILYKISPEKLIMDVNGSGKIQKIN